MAKSRQQLINTSSFLSDQREKIGGLNVKRSTITADSFKKGTSQESLDNIENRVGANEKKITLIKNIIKAQKSDLGENLRSLEPEQESKSDQQQMGSPLLESLQSIASTVDSIRNTLIRQQDADEDAAEKMRIAGEKADRDKQEKGLENTEPKPLAKLGDKIVAPVMSIFDKIFNFIKTLILGKFLMNFLDWFSNPANQGKIASFVRFIKDWWPALTAAVLLFGTGFTSLAVGLVKLVAGFTVKLIALVPQLLAALAKLKAGKLLKMIPGGPKVKGAILLGGGLLTAFGIGKMMNKEEGGGEITGDDGGGTTERTSQSFTTRGGPEAEQLKNQMAESRGEETQGFNKGGTVPGSGNKDTVPAMLTPGEFVMSKGAVQEYGVDHLEGMNAAAGGTNIPTLKKVEVPHYEGGGIVNNAATQSMGMEGGVFNNMFNNILGYNGGGEVMRTSENATIRGGQVVSGNMSQSRVDYTRKKLELEKARFEAISTYGYKSPEANEIRKQILILDGTPADAIYTDRKGNIKVKGYSTYKGSGGTGEKKGGGFGLKRMIGGAADLSTMGMFDFDKRSGGGGLGKTANAVKRGIGGALDFATLGMFDFDKKNPEGSPKGFGPARMMGGLADFATMGLTDFDKRGAGNFQFNPIGGGDNKKYEVKSRTPKNTVVAYQQEVNKNQKQKTAPASGGNEIPSFDVAPIRDPLKMVTLQIVLF